MLTKSSIIPLQMINFIFTLFILLLQSSSIKNLDLLDNRHNASCYQDSECPSRMHCKLSEDEINLCICESGYTYSHPFARCEPSKRIFHDFRINGPTIINLPKKEVKYEVNFFKSDDQNKGNWQYEWLIQDGHEFANFCGLNTSTLKLFNLTTGFILFGISISNESAYGYIPHNLTILSPNQTKQNEHPTINGRPIVIAENLTVYLPTKYAILSGIKSKNANKFKWTPSDNFPIKMIVGSNLNMPELFLTNLISGQYYFNLTVKNDEFEDNKIVGLNILNGFDELNSIEITLMNQEKIIDFTYVKQEKLSTAIEDILTGHFGHEIIIQFNEIEFNEKEQQILLIFHAFMKDLAAKKDLLDVNKMIDILNGNSTFKRSFDILEIKTHFCTLSCGHGICNNFTKKCICDDFWMQNIFNGKQDCTWPIIALWIFALFILMIIAKIVHILWMNEEQNAVKASQLVKNLIGQQNGRKHLAGRLSPIKQFKKGKAWNNSVKGILQNFDSHQNRSSTNRRQILPKMNEESDCYDEEEDEESSSSFSDE